MIQTEVEMIWRVLSAGLVDPVRVLIEQGELSQEVVRSLVRRALLDRDFEMLKILTRLPIGTILAEERGQLPRPGMV